MKITNLGPIKEANVDFNKLNIFFGPNNSGKTYLSYAIYGIVKHVCEHNNYDLSNYLDTQINEQYISSHIIDKSNLYNSLIRQIKKDLTTNFQTILEKTFGQNTFDKSTLSLNTDDIKKLFMIDTELAHKQSKLTRFKGDVYSLSYSPETMTIKTDKSPFFFWSDHTEGDQNLKIDLSKKDTAFLLSQYIKNSLLIKVVHNLYIPAERNGANVFRDEINKKRSNIISFYSEESSADNEKKKVENNTPKYPMPISDYLVFLNNLDSANDFFEYPLESNGYSKKYIQKVLRGKYVLDQKNQLTFRELLTKKDTSKLRYKREQIPFNITSSSIKSLYGFSDYINFYSQPNDIVFIDEPEMNLDPQKQVDLASLLAKMAENNISLFVSTHSDYIFRKLTNISLSQHLSLYDNTISIFSFNNGIVEKLGAVWEHDYISNFDSPLEEIDTEFNRLYQKLPENEISEDSFDE